MNINQQITIFSRVSYLDKMLFTKHLGLMINSGIPVAESIETIHDQSPNPAFRKVLEQILSDITNGQSLTTALSRQKKIFDPLYLNLITVGEESGTLVPSLDYLAQQMRRTYEFRKKVQGALLYPAIVLTAAVCIGMGISFFVLPQLIPIFSSLNTELPLSTKILLWFATTMQHYGIYIISGSILFVLLMRYIVSLPPIKPIWHRLLLSMPVFGQFYQHVALASLTRNLGITLKSGIPIVSALRTEYDATQNMVYKKYLKEIIADVEKGKTISEILQQKQYHFIPLIVTKMIGVGEKTGKLDEMLLYLGDFFEDDVDNFAKTLPTLIEPVVLIIIGLVVGFVALAIISPIYGLTGSIHK